MTTKTTPTNALLVVGNEEFLRARAIDDYLTHLHTIDPDLSRRTTDADELTAGEVQDHLSPELFGGMPVLTITSGNKLTKTALAAVTDAIGSTDCALIIEIPKPAEAGGKATIAALQKAGATYVNVALSTKPWERTAWIERFATDELRRTGLRPTQGTITALVDGEPDLRGLATRIEQLAIDHDATNNPNPTITPAHVAAVVTSAAVTGFAVSDALTARNPHALAPALRTALDAGAAPLFVQAACLTALRNIAAIRTGKTPRLPPAKARELQRAAQHWSAPALAKAIHEMGVIGETVRSSSNGENDLLAALLRAATA